MSRKKMIRTFSSRILARLTLVLLTGALFHSCQRDDLCPATTQTTPRVVIEFQDFEDPGRLKAVPDLVVIASGMKDTLLGPVNTNSISVPLKTNQNITEYLLIRNAGSPEENTDTIRFSYQPDLQYLNRACGYKVNYSDMQAILLGDQESWILSYNQFEDNIENEEETHFSFNH